MTVDPPVKKAPLKKMKMIDLVLTFAMPTLLGKCFIAYYGAYYAKYPGEGYGYALAGSIAFTVCMVGRFLWRYRHHED